MQKKPQYNKMLSGFQKTIIQNFRTQIFEKECNWMKKVREITRLLKQIKIHQQKLEPFLWCHDSDWVPQIEESMRKQQFLLQLNQEKKKIETDLLFLQSSLKNFLNWNQIDVESPTLTDDEYELIHGIYFNQVLS
jgi:hypothetical protein